MALVPRWASASETEKACFAAAEAGQRARQEGKLAEARDAFTRCAEPTCPTAVTDDCTRWIAEIDEAMPTVVIATLDAAGNDLARGKVRIDGKDQDVLGGTPIPLEPGTHVIVLEVPEVIRVQDTVVVREHEKNRRVTLRLPAPPPPPPVHRPTPLPFVLGGVGLVFGAAFGGFATAGFIDRQSAGCDAGCSPGDYSRVRAELVTADVSAGIAVALVAIAIIDFAITRSGHSSRRAALPWVVRF